MKPLPSLTAVKYFEVSARLQSFTAAAAELHVTQGAVSRMIQTLEEQLEARLFERNGRWISLTPAGKVYHEQITAGLNQIAEAVSGSATAYRQQEQESQQSISAITQALGG